MQIKVTVSEDEIKVLVAEHLKAKLGLSVNPEDISTGSGSYDHAYYLGKYGDFSVPPVKVTAASVEAAA